jgi:hypothetical protein
MVLEFLVVNQTISQSKLARAHQGTVKWWPAQASACMRPPQKKEKLKAFTSPIFAFTKKYPQINIMTIKNRFNELNPPLKSWVSVTFLKYCRLAN